MFDRLETKKKLFLILVVGHFLVAQAMYLAVNWNDMTSFNMPADLERSQMCLVTSFVFNNSEAMFYINKSEHMLKSEYEKCSAGNMSSLETIQVQDLTNSSSEEFLITFDPDYILKREAPPKNSSLKCTLYLFDKKMNKDGDFLHDQTSDDEMHLTHKKQLGVKLIGFYFVECLLNNTIAKPTTVYREVFSILPSSLKKLVERNGPSREATEKLRESLEKFDSKTNLTLKDIKFEECEKLEGSELEDKMNVIIIVLDSVSYLKLRRVFPLTHEYLTKDLENNLMFENLNILGENTLPNMLPMLSGVIKEENNELGLNDETMFFKDTLYQSTYNDLFPFVWYDYEKIGYVRPCIEKMIRI
jgi:hypothetical protein